MSKYENGNIIKGTVSGIESYGAFVSFDEYYSGLIHISEIAHVFVDDISKYLQIGDVIYVQILDVDEQNFHLKLSIKNIDYKTKKNYLKKKKISETKIGFKTLEYKLPIWIKQKSTNFKME